MEWKLVPTMFRNIGALPSSSRVKVDESIADALEWEKCGKQYLDWKVWRLLCELQDSRKCPKEEGDVVSGNILHGLICNVPRSLSTLLFGSSLNLVKDQKHDCPDPTPEGEYEGFLSEEDGEEFFECEVGPKPDYSSPIKQENVKDAAIPSPPQSILMKKPTKKENLVSSVLRVFPPKRNLAFASKDEIQEFATSPSERKLIPEVHRECLGIIRNLDCSEIPRIMEEFGINDWLTNQDLVIQVLHVLNSRGLMEFTAMAFLRQLAAAFPAARKPKRRTREEGTERRRGIIAGVRY